MNRRALAILAAVVVVVSGVTATTAFTAVSAERGVTVDVVGDADQLLGLTPHDGPNGRYAYQDGDDLLVIDVSSTNPNGDVRGVGSRAVTRFDDVFNVTNRGTQAVAVWIEGPEIGTVDWKHEVGERGVRIPIQGQENAVELQPGETLEVGFRIDIEGVTQGSFTGSILIHASANVEPGDPDDPTPPPSDDLVAITGFHPPQIDGLLYGSTGEPLPDGKAAEWADAYVEEVALLAEGDGALAGTFYTKDVGEDLYVGLYVPQGISDADEVRTVVLQLDRDDDGEQSDGDARILAHWGDPHVAEFQLPAVQAARIEIQEYRDGQFVTVEGDGVDPDGSGLASMSTASPPDGGVSLEGRVNGDVLDELLGDEGGSDGEVGYAVFVETTSDIYGVNGRPLTRAEAYPFAFEVRTPILALPSDNVGIDHIELTQSVQTATNSLPVVRNKTALARVFVTHDNAETTTVQVTLEAFAVEGGVTSLGTVSQEYDAPPGTPDREDRDDSANFELPADWMDTDALVLKATVYRAGYLELSSSDNTLWDGYLPVETYDPSIYVVRVNDGTDASPSQVSDATVDTITDSFTRVMPVANPTYTEVGWEVVGPQQGNDGDALIADLNRAADMIDAARVFALLFTGDLPPPVDQLFGVTVRGGGLSDPAWGDGESRVAWGGLGSSSGQFVMAHEVNHNIGNDDWGRHVGDGITDDPDTPVDESTPNGCGAGGTDPQWPRSSDVNIGEVGWDPAVDWRMVPTDHPELMGYCFTSNPRKWMSPYRWTRTVDRFEGWEPGQPVHPDLQGSSATATGDLALAAIDEEPTVRVVTGRLFEGEDGELLGDLDPSFEMPGVARPERPPVEEPAAYLEVLYSDQSSTRIPIAASFDPLETDHVVTSVPFSITVPDNGAVVGVSLVRAGDESTLEERFATGWTLDSAEVSTPDGFERGQTVDVGVSVEATAKAQLYNQLLYSPDGVLWYPYGKPFTGESFPAVFTRLPGSEAGQFMLLISDGVETRSVTSSTFRVPSLPPQVSILRANRWTTSDVEGALVEASDAGVGDVAVDEAPGEPRNLATPVTATAGSLVSLNAKAVDERGRALAPTELTWEVRDAQGLLLASGRTPLGERFAYRFEAPGRYTMTVRGVDTPTELSTTDTIEVVVSPPGLPDASAVEAFRKGTGTGMGTA